MGMARNNTYILKSLHLPVVHAVFTNIACLLFAFVVIKNNNYIDFVLFDLPFYPRPMLLVVLTVLTGMLSVARYQIINIHWMALITFMIIITNIHTHTHTYTYTHTHTHARTHARARAHTHTHTHIYIYIYI